MKFIGAWCFLFLWAGVAFAQDHPTFGLAYNETENSSLNYECRLEGTGQLLCEFVQMRVTKQALPEALETELAKARAKFPNVQKEFEDPASCTEVRQFVGFLQGQVDINELVQTKNGRPSDFLPKMKEARTQFRSKPESFNVMLKMADFCRTKSEDDYLSLVRTAHDQDTRTCRISTNRFTQKFRIASSSNVAVWVADEGPQGECGIVQLSRFEAEKLGSDGFLVWTYVARKAVTVPQGETALGKCGDIVDEKEYRFSWKDRGNIQLGCEWIKFSAY